MEEEKVRTGLTEALGEHVGSLDTSMIDYVVAILQEFNPSDGESVSDSIGPFLADSGIEEKAVKDICDTLSQVLFGRSAKTETSSDSLRLLDAPVQMTSAVTEEEAAMSLSFGYTPKMGRGAKVAGNKTVVNEFVDNSEDARLKKEKKEALMRYKKEKMREKEALANARRDTAVFMRRPPGADKSRDVQLHNFDIQVSGRTLIRDSSISLAAGRRYGLVGRNGAGKTTLLRHIAGRDIAGIPAHLQILHVEQEAVGSDKTVLQSVLEADAEREALLTEEKQILKEMQEKEEARLAKKLAKQGGINKSFSPSPAAVAPEKGSRLAAIYARLQEIDADSSEARAAAILAGLGFSQEAQQRPTKEFSGGWRMRMALSRALFCKPDLLLLDEPTNMLDISAVLWLEAYLQQWESTLLVVSHDRNFLNNVVTDVIHLQAEQLTTYHGNYDTFERSRMERLKNQAKAVEAQEKLRAHVQQFIDRFRYKAGRASLVQSRIKMLDKMEMIPALLEDPTCSFSFPEPEELAPPLIQFDEVSFAYPPKKGLGAVGSISAAGGNTNPTLSGKKGGKKKGPPELFTKLSFSLDMDSRVALVGANGQGKTTLLKLITGELKPSKGFVFIHRRIRFGTFSQHHVDQLSLEDSPLEFFVKSFPGSDPQAMRAHMGRYGVTGDLALQPIGTLSGGQKSRVVFALLGWLKPHFLILDEPTNHLDVETVDVLAGALNEFTGGLVLVTHDERLIKTVCQDLWVVNKGTVKRHEGDFEAYKKSILVENKFNF
ncbi:ATP-binding cassette, regulator of translational elongation [Balamuthia mandrillaris]